MAEIPKFESPEEEREFWDTTDTTDLEADSIEDAGVLGDRAPMTTFAMRIAAKDLDRTRRLAESRGIGVSQLMREWILERLDRAEAGSKSGAELLIEAIHGHAAEIAAVIAPTMEEEQRQQLAADQNVDLMEALKRSVAESKAERRETA